MNRWFLLFSVFICNISFGQEIAPDYCDFVTQVLNIPEYVQWLKIDTLKTIEIVDGVVNDENTIINYLSNCNEIILGNPKIHTHILPFSNVKNINFDDLPGIYCVEVIVRKDGNYGMYIMNPSKYRNVDAVFSLHEGKWLLNRALSQLTLR